MKILITGTHGFVGARALQHFPDAVPVPGELVRTGGKPLADFIRSHHPDILLNTAAISDIGVCEKNPAASYAANVTLPVELAHTARETGAKLVSFSSDQVYTGCEDTGPYRESDNLPVPTNTYARHKVEAEQRVLDLLPEAVMLRATWMYDMPMYHHSNRGNFLVNTVKALLGGRPLQASSLEYRGITYVRQVVEYLEPVFRLPGGVYNYGSENCLNMLETTQALLRALGLEGTVQDTERTPHNLWMNGDKLRAHGIVFDKTPDGFRCCAVDYGL